MNVRLLEYVVALDEHRSFRRAAEAMRVTQPTFSRGVAALEAALGVRLFDRSNSRVEPTPEGAMLLARARRLLADVAGMREALDDYQNLRSGRVVVGVGPFALDLSVIDCVVRLATRHPLLQIEIIEGDWRGFGPKLLSGDVEVAVMETAFIAADARFQVDALPAHQGCFFGRRGHPLHGRKGVTLTELLQFPIVGVRMPPRAIPGGRAGNLSLDPVTGDVIPHIATTSFAAAKAIIARTDGVGIAAPVQLTEDIERGVLAILDADVSSLKSGYGIAYLRGRSLSRAAAAFVATLKEVEAEHAATATALKPAAARGRSPAKRRR